jgi:hypothetical protein
MEGYFMKKLLPLCIVGILLLSGLGTAAFSTHQTKEGKIKTESIAFSEPVLQDNGQYVTLSLKEATSSLQDPGTPVVPVVTKVFTFPFGTIINSVDVRFSDINQLTLLQEVVPAGEPFPVDDTAVNEPIKDPAVYDSAAVYPTTSYGYSTGVGLDDKEHVVYLAVQCYPVRYSPANNVLYYSEDAQIQITYVEPAIATVFPEQYDLVIIAPSQFSSALQPLINHKISMGVNTTLKTTEEIYAGYSGFDNAEKIKYFIKDALETWGITYVLLVGGVTKLPIRTTWFYERHHEHFWNETIITDLYYADIYDANGDFCSWDSNGNGLYGETYEGFPGDNDTIDFYPDVNVGRLPCEKTAEVKTVVNKIIHYETETAGASWFKNIILIGGDTFPGWDGYEGEEQNQITEKIMSEFTPIQLWTSDGTFSARALNQVLNKGAGFIDYSGHGFEIGIATHPPDSNDSTWIGYHTNNLLGALNGYKLPIIFFDACLTAKLDFNISELIGYASVNAQLFVDRFSFISSRLFPAFAWCMVKKRNGGAIATIGATRTAFGDLDYGCGYFAIHFWQAYNTSEKVSQMLTQAQIDYIINIPFDRFTVEEFILLGDPSLQIGGY